MLFKMNNNKVLEEETSKLRIGLKKIYHNRDAKAWKTEKTKRKKNLNLKQCSPEDLLFGGDFCVLTLLTAQQRTLK